LAADLHFSMTTSYCCAGAIFEPRPKKSNDDPKSNPNFEVFFGASVEE